MRSIVCVLGTETLLQSLGVFCVSRKPLYIIKYKASVFWSFLGLFYMFIISPPPPPQVPQSFVYLGLQYSPLPFLPVTTQCSSHQTAFSSLSSCSWRVTHVSCSLFLKMKLVPPSLPQSSYGPSPFVLYCSACFGSLYVSISVHVVATFNSILHFKQIQCVCFWHLWQLCQSHFITSILSTALISVVPFVTSQAVLYIDCIYSNLSITWAYHTCFTPQSVTQTMCLICELLTEEPEGGCDMIPFETFKELYTHRAQWTAVQVRTKIQVSVLLQFKFL